MMINYKIINTRIVNLQIVSWKGIGLSGTNGPTNGWSLIFHHPFVGRNMP